MASENETVADIVQEMRDIFALTGIDKNKSHLMGFFERIEAAHQREVAELRECLEQAYGDKIGTYMMKGNEVERWRKALREEGGAK